MARRPSPNVTPFIPPLSSPNPSPHPQPLTSAPATPYVNPYTSYLPAAAPVAYPGYPYPPFASPQGLSADYAGYPAFLGPTPLAQPVHLPPAHPSPWTPPHTTPWAQHAQLPQYPPFQPQQAFYHPHATPAMQYGQFSPDPWGMPPQPAHPPNPRNTWPAHPQQPLHQPPAPQRPISRSAVYSADRVDPFLPGSCCTYHRSPFLPLFYSPHRRPRSDPISRRCRPCRGQAQSTHNPVARGRQRQAPSQMEHALYFQLLPTIRR